jgi:hypothetical protein
VVPRIAVVEVAEVTQPVTWQELVDVADRPMKLSRPSRTSGLVHRLISSSLLLSRPTRMLDCLALLLLVRHRILTASLSRSVCVCVCCSCTSARFQGQFGALHRPTTLDELLQLRVCYELAQVQHCETGSNCTHTYTLSLMCRANIPMRHWLLATRTSMLKYH